MCKATEEGIERIRVTLKRVTFNRRTNGYEMNDGFIFKSHPHNPERPIGCITHKSDNISPRWLDAYLYALKEIGEINGTKIDFTSPTPPYWMQETNRGERFAFFYEGMIEKRPSRLNRNSFKYTIALRNPEIYDRSDSDRSMQYTNFRCVVLSEVEIPNGVKIDTTQGKNPLPDNFKRHLYLCREEDLEQWMGMEEREHRKKVKVIKETYFN